MEQIDYVVSNQNSKIINFPENRENYGKKISTTTIAKK